MCTNPRASGAVAGLLDGGVRQTALVFVSSIRALKAVLAALLALLVVLQFLSFPGGFRHDAQQRPDEAWLQWPLTLAVGSVLLAAEIVVVGIWNLLTLTGRRQLLSADGLRWLTRITWACGYAAAMMSLLFLAVALMADDPGAPMILLFVDLCIVTLTLFAFVMRSALAQALHGRVDPAA